MVSNSEEASVQSFLSQINEDRLSQGESPISWKDAVKFLNARKGDVDSAINLFNSYYEIRKHEKLLEISPFSEAVCRELVSEKVYILKDCDADGCRIILVTAKLHIPSESSHQAFLSSLLYQLDLLLDDPDVQSRGLTLLFDMTDAKMANHDFSLTLKTFRILKDHFPAKLKKIYIICSPLWFRAPFQLLAAMSRAKMHNRVRFISTHSDIREHVPASILPARLGGQVSSVLQASYHRVWLRKCFEAHPDSKTIDIHSVLQRARGGNLNINQLSLTLDSMHSTNCGGGPNVTCGGDTHAGDATSNDNGSDQLNSSGGSGPSHFPKPGRPQSLHVSSDDVAAGADLSSKTDQLLTIKQLRKLLQNKSQFKKEYQFFSNIQPDYNACSISNNNPDLNRYSNIPTLNSTRVILRNGAGGFDGYIHANYVNGYNAPKAYIASQGPTARTTADFWQMVVQEKVAVIAMTTRLMEDYKSKCAAYWPASPDQTVTHGNITIMCVKVQNTPEGHTHTELLVNGSTTVHHLHFTSWPDFGVPENPDTFLSFLELMKTLNGGNPAPIVVHCSAGIGRTGTLIAIDMCVSEMDAIGKTSVLGAASRLRAQRAKAIQSEDQYEFCYRAVIAHCEKQSSS